MTPIVDVMSGMSTTLENNPVSIEPEHDPGERHADRQPHCHHGTEGDDQDDDREPEAESFRGRHLELGERLPTELDLATPSSDGIGGTDLVADRHRVFEGCVGGRLELGVHDSTRLITLGGDLPLIARRVRALQRLHPVDLGDLGEERLDHPADLGILNPVVGLEHDVADLTSTLATELVIQDVDPALALHVGQREVGAIAGTHRPHRRPEHDDTKDPRSRTRRRRRKHISARRFNMAGPSGPDGRVGPSSRSAVPRGAR